tara:strand:+ start:131 stop:382 length:252 start_codon:yes stop_codon:yes gene_type:complete
MKRFYVYLTTNIIAIFLIVTNAYAYLDPGTGSFILQAIIGFLAAVTAGFTYYWSKVKNFFLKLFKKNNEHQETNKDQERHEDR